MDLSNITGTSINKKRQVLSQSYTNSNGKCMLKYNVADSLNALSRALNFTNESVTGYQYSEGDNSCTIFGYLNDKPL